MIKKSWPWLDGNDMGAELHGDYRDMAVNTQQVPELLVAENYRNMPYDEEGMEGYQSPETEYRESLFSPVDEDDEIDIEDLLGAFLEPLSSTASTLCFGIDEVDHNNLKMSNITLVSSDINQYDESIYKISADIRYHNFGTKFSNFFINNPPNEIDLFLENIYCQIRPVSSGIVISKNKSLSKLAKRAGFVINKIAKDTFLLSKNDLDKKAMVKIYSNGKSSNNPRVMFSCDIAKTYQEKASGLQAYPNLSLKSGLLFEYGAPRDVIYHMGSVRYPIDIIFVSESGSIKKISKNIDPGSSAMFSCSNVKAVLEICGGLSEVLGIKEGDLLISKKMSHVEDKDFVTLNKFCGQLGLDNLFLKRSRYLKTGLSSFYKSNILNLNELEPKNLIKIASDVIKPKLLKNKNIVIFDIDDEIFNTESYLKLFASKKLNTDEEDVSIDIYKEAYSPLKDNGGNHVFFKIPTRNFLSEGFYDLFGKEYVIKGGSRNSLSEFLSKNKHSDILDEIIIATASGENCKLVIATRTDCDREALRELLRLKALEASGANYIDTDVDAIKIGSDLYDEKLLYAMADKYQSSNVKLVSSIKKIAGIPVPDDTKSKAKRAESFFDRADKLCTNVLNNLKQNADEYDKIKDNVEAIPGTKGQYNESVKRNSRVVKRLLINIRDGIKIMNDIKDISTTSEIIDALALSAKETSSLIKEIFNLIEKIDSSDFHEVLTQKTGELENLIGDLSSTISRMKQYINSNIMGIVILSE